MNKKNKCSYCYDSKCCTYVTQQIDTPRSKKDFDFLLWQISHQKISIYQDDDGWFIMFSTECTHLKDNGHCGIYETRPQICRDYSNDYCEYDSPAEDGFKRYYRNYDELLSYCKQRFKRWGQ